MTIPFCKPIVPDFVAVESWLQGGLKSGHLSNFGKLYHLACNLLKLALKINSDKDIILTSSGHTALMAAYSALNVKRIVMPSFTFEATRAAALLQGMEVELVDVSPSSGCIGVETLSKVPLDSYDAVVAVCALSTIPDLESLQDFCIRYGKKLVVDGAPSYGTEYVYNYGDAYCLSFHATKTLPIGEGGAVIINKEHHDAVKQYISFGFDENKEVKMVGINGKISEYSCAILVDMIHKANKYITTRRTNLIEYAMYLQYFIPTSLFIDTVYCSLPIFLPDKKQAEKSLRDLNDNGVQALQYYRPLDDSFPISKSLYERNICLPIHHGVTSKDIKFISNIILDNVS